MKLLRWFLLFAVGVSCVEVPSASADRRLRKQKRPYRKQWAIIIGVNYAGREDAAAEGVSRLKNAENDARAVAATLTKHYGYIDQTVKLLIGRQATKAAIVRLFGDAFLGDPDVVGQGDSVLVFFAGHGDRQTRKDRSRAVLWPYNVQVNPGKGIDSSSCVRISNILQDLQLCHARHKLLILDSCHSGEVFRAGGLARSAGRFRFDPDLFKKDVLQAIAASRGFQKAQDGDKNSPFTAALLESLHGGIKSSSFGATALFSRIPERVKQFSRQDPRGGTISGDGEFYFFRRGKPEPFDMSKVTTPTVEQPPGEANETESTPAGESSSRVILWIVGSGVAVAAMALVLLVWLRRAKPAAAESKPPGAAAGAAVEIQTVRARGATVQTISEGATSKLVLAVEGRDVESVCVFASQTDLGRSVECGFCFANGPRQISSSHARLRYVPDGDQFLVEDLDSRNGTYVVGRKVTEHQQLEPGMQVQLGQSLWLDFDKHVQMAGSIAELVHKSDTGETISRFLLIPRKSLPLKYVVEDPAIADMPEGNAAIYLGDGGGFFLGRETGGPVFPRRLKPGELLQLGQWRIRVVIP